VSTLAYGLQANVLFPSKEMSGWAGAFGGLERFDGSGTMSGGAQGPTGSTKVSYSGWQAGVQGGADWAVAPGLVVGPFASLAFGQYGSYSGELSAPGVPTQTTSGDVKDKGTHEWLTLGVRGSYGL
jgi:hypothetical protein